MTDKKNIKSYIETILFKPLFIENKDQDEKNIIIIISTDYNIKTSIDISLKKTKIYTATITALNISKTIMMDQPFVEVIQVTDLDKFKENISIIEDDPDFLEEINFANDICVHFAGIVSTQLDNLSKVISTIQLINKKSNDDSGELLMHNESYESVVNLALKTVDGKSLELNEENMNKIGGVIVNIMEQHNHDNLENKSTVKKLKDELEYKIIESLPINIKVENLNLNMDSIINQIKENQGNNGTEE